jgi:hypothetical protein
MNDVQSGQTFHKEEAWNPTGNSAYGRCAGDSSDPVCLHLHGCRAQYVIRPRRLERWLYIVLVIVLFLMIPVLLKAVSGGTGLLGGLQDFANSGAYFPLMLIAGRSALADASAPLGPARS